jgi:MoaA/NifB/PqqE/SkfB family radical SAM enzyme
LKSRIDALHRLRAVNISLLGGEPLLHPKIDQIVEYTNHQSQVSITTNGFLVSDKLIERLNEAGLDNMQVSIDTLYPDTSGYIQKSVKSIAPKLRRLKKLAKFDVHVNVVLCENSKDMFKTTLSEIQKFGFFVSVSLVHDERGMIEIGGSEHLELWEHHFKKCSPFTFIEYEYGKQLLQGKRPKWQCRAGARYLYIDEFGNVQYCSTQRGRLNKPITKYTKDDIRINSHNHKGCESGCSVFCVYQLSQIDNAPLSMAKSLYKALRRGSLFNGLHTNVSTPEDINESEDLRAQPLKVHKRIA